MKKTFLFLTALTLVFSCSKSNNEDAATKELPRNFQNMVGNWEFTSVIKTNGTQIAYPHRCTTTKDYINIIANTTMTIYSYQTTCSVQTDNSCNNYYFVGDVIKNCNSFDDATVVSLTATTLRVRFPTTSQFAGIPDDVTNVIFTKR